MANNPATKHQRRSSCLFLRPRAIPLTLVLLILILVGYATVFLHRNHKIEMFFCVLTAPEPSPGRVQIDLLRGLANFLEREQSAQWKGLIPAKQTRIPSQNLGVLRRYFDNILRSLKDFTDLASGWMHEPWPESARFEPDDCFFLESFPEAHSFRDHIRINNITNILVSPTDINLQGACWMW